MGKVIKVTNAEKEYIANLYQNGFSYEEIANRLQRSIKTIRRTLQEKGLVEKKPNHKESMERFNLVCEMYYLHGMSIEQISKELNIRANTIRSMVRGTAKSYDVWLPEWRAKHLFKDDNAIVETEEVNEQEKVIDLLIGITNKLDELLTIWRN